MIYPRLANILFWISSILVELWVQQKNKDQGHKNTIEIFLGGVYFWIRITYYDVDMLIKLQYKLRVQCSKKSECINCLICHIIEKYDIFHTYIHFLHSLIEVYSWNISYNKYKWKNSFNIINRNARIWTSFQRQNKSKLH